MPLTPIVKENERAQQEPRKAIAVPLGRSKSVAVSVLSDALPLVAT
jgi:hypothetical protein